MASNPPPVRHIYISGVHSVGKTTLVHELRKEDLFANFQYVSEFARKIIADKGWTQDEYNYRTHRENFKILNLDILKGYRGALEQYEHRDAIFDRGPMDSLVYIRYYMNDDEYRTAVESPEACYCIERFRRAHVFIVEPHPEFIAVDGVRLDSTIQELRAYTALMLQSLDELNVPYHVITEKDLRRRVEIVSDPIKNQ